MEENVTNAAARTELIPARFSPEMLTMMRPHAHSRWSARVAMFGETRYAENENPWSPGQALIVRTPPSIGPQYAETMVGVPLGYNRLRPDGLRTGAVDFRSPSGAITTSVQTVGYVEHAVADDHGIVAVLMVLDRAAHEDLLDLAAHDALADAMLCCHHRADRSTLRRSRWELLVVDVLAATAKYVAFTSLTHSAGCRVVRQLEADEPLSARDFDFSGRLYVPGTGGAASDLPALAADAADVNGGAVTSAVRQGVNTSTASVSHGAAVGFQISQYTITHNLGKIPTVSPSLTNITGESSADRFTGVFQDAVGVNSFVIRVVSTNPNVTISGTMKVDFW